MGVRQTCTDDTCDLPPQVLLWKNITNHSSYHKRELFDVASVGNGAFYGWVRESDNKRVDDRNIKGLSFKQIKEKYE